MINLLHYLKRLIFLKPLTVVIDGSIFKLLFLIPSSSLNVSNRSLNASNRSLNVTSRTQAVAESANYILENYGTSLPVAVIELIGSSESNALTIVLNQTEFCLISLLPKENHNAV